MMNGLPNNLPPSPPQSVARSSTGTGLYSMSSSAGPTRKYSMQAMEGELEIHHRVLRDFLNQSIRDDRGYHPHNRARDKLLRLSAIQFQELSTDVYDELLRREEERAASENGGGGAAAAAQNGAAPRFLLPKSNFHPKRNQARQKLSTLASKKFRELATDVLFELERRVPRLAGHSIDRAPSPTGSTASYQSRGPGRRPGPGMSVKVPPPPLQNGRRPSATSPNMPYSPGIFEDGRSINGSAGGPDYSRPLPKQFQSNTMVPNKSVMVEDDDDQSDDGSAFDIDGGPTTRTSRRTTNMSGVMPVRNSTMIAEHQVQLSRLEQRTVELEDQLKQKNEELQAAQNELKQKDEAILKEQTKSSEFLSDLERQVQLAEDLNRTLNENVSQLQSTNAQLEERLQEQQAALEGGSSSEWRSKYEELDQKFQDHQQLTDQVRQESATTLQELTVLSQQHDKAENEKEELLNKIASLEASVGDWRTKFSKTKTQLRSLKATSMALHADYHPDAGALALNDSFADPKGLVKDVHVTNYQSSINELLHLARAEDTTGVFEYMRTIVSAVRALVSDVDIESNNAPDEVTKERARLKKRVSNAANSLMTTSRTFANSMGLSPVSLVDAAASNLTTAVIELIKVVKVRSSPAVELEVESDGLA